MFPNIHYVPNCTLCSQLYIMFPTIHYVLNCTLCSQLYIMLQTEHYNKIYVHLMCILFWTDHYVPKCRFSPQKWTLCSNWTTLCQNIVDFATIQIHISRNNLSNPLLLEIQVQSIILVSGWSSSCQDYYIKDNKESLITICLDGSTYTLYIHS